MEVKVLKLELIPPTLCYAGELMRIQSYQSSDKSEARKFICHLVAQSRLKRGANGIY